jgi:hypothetical protein
MGIAAAPSARRSERVTRWMPVRARVWLVCERSRSSGTGMAVQDSVSGSLSISNYQFSILNFQSHRSNAVEALVCERAALARHGRIQSNDGRMLPRWSKEQGAIQLGRHGARARLAMTN